MNLTRLLAEQPVGWNTGLPEHIGAEIKEAALSLAQPATAPAISAVYLLFRGSEIVYVGQSSNVLARIGNHVTERIKEFDSYTFIEVPAEQRIMRERQLIRTYSPYYNVVSLKDQGFLRVSELAEYFEVPEAIIKRIIEVHSLPSPSAFGCHYGTKVEWIRPYIDNPPEDPWQKFLSENFNQSELFS